MNRSPAYRLFRACRPRPYLLIALLPVVASAKYGYKLLIPEAAAQGVLPSEGPAAARLNPASLADVGLASAAYGHYGSMSGKSGIGFVQLALGMPGEFLPLPVGPAAGFGYMYQDLGVPGWMEPSFAWASATRRLRAQMSLWEHRGFGSGLLAKLAYRIIPPVLAGTGA
jgi:hypothetical protein